MGQWIESGVTVYLYGRFPLDFLLDNRVPG